MKLKIKRVNGEHFSPIRGSDRLEGPGKPDKTREWIDKLFIKLFQWQWNLQEHLELLRNMVVHAENLYWIPRPVVHGPDLPAVRATIDKEFPISVDYEDIFSTLENLSDTYRTPKDRFKNWVRSKVNGPHEVLFQPLEPSTFGF